MYVSNTDGTGLHAKHEETACQRRAVVELQNALAGTWVVVRLVARKLGGVNILDNSLAFAKRLHDGFL